MHHYLSATEVLAFTGFAVGVLVTAVSIAMPGQQLAGVFLGCFLIGFCVPMGFIGASDGE